MIKKYSTQLYLLAAILVSLIVSLFEDQLDPYFMDIALNVGINVTLAVSLNLVNGYTGQFSLGHGAFMAIGAYGSAVLSMQAGGPLINMLGGGTFAQSIVFLFALITGGVFAGILGWVVGVPSLRLRGDYLAIVTLGFNEIVKVVLLNTDSEGYFGGALGLRGIPSYSNTFWIFSIAAICIYVVGSMVNSTYGRGFLVVRDDEVAGESMGINTVRYKVIAFVIGAFFAGLAGGLYAHFRSAVSADGFNFLKSVDIVVMVILGGMGSNLGVVLAAIALTVLNERLRDAEEYRMVVFSLILIIMMIVRPQGLLPNVVLQRNKTKKTV